MKYDTFYDKIALKEGTLMSNKEKFLIVKRFIDQMDYYDLLTRGAPSDEYDVESKEISKKIRYDHSVQEIAGIIASVFNKHFDAYDDATGFLSVAEQIKSELSN